MVKYEEDSDLMQWGLRLLDGDPGSHPEYYGDLTQHADIYHGQYLSGHYDMDSSSVENDEIIAHTLQEELSQLAVTEAPEPEPEPEPSNAEEHQEWPSPRIRNYYSGHESGQEETDDIRPSTSCSSPEEISYDGDEYSYSLELTDESVFDGELGKRLDQMIPIPHVPRINGDIPSYDEATSDHQRLLDRLQSYGLVELKVQGDGNCQFRALSHQFYRTPEHHKFVRKQVVNQLKLHREIYEGYVPMAYDDYLRRMSKSGEWGDHVTLQAAADSYGVRILVITSFKDRCKIEILPKVQRSERVIYLSFWAEVHYNSIYPQEASNFTWSNSDLDIPSSESRKKKRWWNFGNKH